MSNKAHMKLRKKVNKRIDGIVTAQSKKIDDLTKKVKDLDNRCSIIDRNYRADCKTLNKLRLEQFKELSKRIDELEKRRGIPVGRFEEVSTVPKCVNHKCIEHDNELVCGCKQIITLMGPADITKCDCYIGDKGERVRPSRMPGDVDIVLLEKLLQNTEDIVKKMTADVLNSILPETTDEVRYACDNQECDFYHSSSSNKCRIFYGIKRCLKVKLMVLKG